METPVYFGQSATQRLGDNEHPPHLATLSGVLASLVYKGIFMQTFYFGYLGGSLITEWKWTVNQTLNKKNLWREKRKRE